MKSLVEKMAVLIVAVVLSVGITSCESNYSKESKHHKQKQYDIHTTEQWIGFISRTTDISEIDKAYKSLEGKDVVDIFKELIVICINTNTNDARFDDNINAFWYLNLGYLLNQKYGQKLAKVYADEMDRIMDNNGYSRTDYNILAAGLVEINYMDDLKEKGERYMEYMISNYGK